MTKHSKDYLKGINDAKRVFSGKRGNMLAKEIIEQELNFCNKVLKLDLPKNDYFDGCRAYWKAQKEILNKSLI